MEQVLIGKLSFINSTPIYYPLESVAGLNGFRLIEGTPTELNARFFRGDLDISVISSHEYGLHAGDYLLLPNLAIASHGAVKSVLFFSKQPLRSLNGRKVLVSEKSQTSVSLFKIILEEFYNVFPVYVSCDLSSPDMHGPDISGYLAIGDEALRLRIESREPYIFDLGETWKKFTGLPFVYAVWAVRRDFFEKYPEKAYKVYRLLKSSKDQGMRILDSIGSQYASHIPMSQEACLAYLRTLCFDLSPKALEGLELFFKYLVARGDYPKPVQIEFLPEITGM